MGWEGDVRPPNMVFELRKVERVERGLEVSWGMGLNGFAQGKLLIGLKDTLDPSGFSCFASAYWRLDGS